MSSATTATAINAIRRPHPALRDQVPGAARFRLYPIPLPLCPCRQRGYNGRKRKGSRAKAPEPLRKHKATRCVKEDDEEAKEHNRDDDGNMTDVQDSVLSVLPEAPDSEGKRMPSNE